MTEEVARAKHENALERAKDAVNAAWRDGQRMGIEEAFKAVKTCKPGDEERAVKALIERLKEEQP